MLNFPFGTIKKTCRLREGTPPVVIDLEKEVCLQVNPLMYQILVQYPQLKFNDLLSELRKRYTWRDIEATVHHLADLAELGIIFTKNETQKTSTPPPRPCFTVTPGFILNQNARSVMSNAVYSTLLSNLSKYTHLSGFVPGVPHTSDAQENADTAEGTYPIFKQIRYARYFSYAAVSELPLPCHALMMFTPIHEEDLPFLKNRNCPLLLFASDHDERESIFNNLSPAYSHLKETDVWFCPHFWLEPEIRKEFPDVPRLIPLPLGVDPLLIDALPAKTELKLSLSQALGNDGLKETPAIGVFGNNGDWLADQLAANDPNRVYLRIAGTQRLLDLHHTFIIENISDADILPDVLKSLDLLIFIASGTVEPHVLSLAAAVGIPTVVVCEEPLPDTPYFGRFYHCDRFDVPTLQEIIEDVLENEELSHTVDLDSISWDTTSKRILQLYGDIGAKHVGSQDSVITPPRPPEYLFAKFYDPAKKKNRDTMHITQYF